jgi:hypothetical protein
MEAQSLDLLNHYRKSFERWQGAGNGNEGGDSAASMGPGIDAEYLSRFAALMESFEAADSPDLKEQATALAEAARRGDAFKIKEMLPKFCDGLINRPKCAQDAEGSAEALEAIMSRLKNAIMAGKSAEAEEAVKEMGGLKLGGRSRELYFLLYDLLLAEDTEKAIGAISLWEKLSKARYH